MNLSEMRDALSSEATKKAEKMEAEIKQLKKELAKKQAIISEKNDMLRVMFNRCHVTMAPAMMCFFCDIRPTCAKMRSVGKKEADK